MFVAVSRGGNEDDAPSGGPMDPDLIMCGVAVEENVQQALLEGGAADADASDPSSKTPLSF